MREQLLYNLICLLLFIMFQSTWSQVSNTRTILPFASTKIGLESWSKGGAYVASWSNPIAPVHNPASSVANGPSLNIEVGKTFPSEFFGLESDNQLILPGYLSFSTIVGNLNLSLGYAKSYNFKMEGGSDTPEPLPDGTGVIVGIKSKTTIQTFFSTIGYSIPHRIAFGITFGLNYLNEAEEIKGTKFESKGNGFGPQVRIGLLYSPLKNLTFGTSFHYSGEIKYDVKLSLPEVNNNNPRQPEVIFPSQNQLTKKFPWSIQFGLNYDVISFLNFYAMLDYQKWSSALANLKDEFQVHIGTKFIPISKFTFGLGFFTLNNSEIAFGLEQKFLTFGIQLQAHKTICFYSTILDSHLLSDKEPKQTYLGIGLRYSKN